MTNIPYILLTHRSFRSTMDTLRPIPQGNKDEARRQRFFDRCYYDEAIDFTARQVAYL